jgi:hypothetical protein
LIWMEMDWQVKIIVELLNCWVIDIFCYQISTIQQLNNPIII